MFMLMFVYDSDASVLLTFMISPMNEYLKFWSSFILSFMSTS